uniref:Uncharacterized protein n=1 Tax=Vitis vinifera TaxID=29760 RepID=F6HPW9_VITVI
MAITIGRIPLWLIEKSKCHKRQTV